MTPNTEQPSADEQEVGTERDTAGGDAVESDAVESDADEDETRSTGCDASHLDDLEDGAGCTEIWEKLSENRE